jgi:hypothetical protein
MQRLGRVRGDPQHRIKIDELVRVDVLDRELRLADASEAPEDGALRRVRLQCVVQLREQRVAPHEEATALKRYSPDGG